jgi:hypothetical protein
MGEECLLRPAIKKRTKTKPIKTAHITTIAIHQSLPKFGDAVGAIVGATVGVVFTCVFSLNL